MKKRVWESDIQDETERETHHEIKEKEKIGWKTTGYVGRKFYAEENVQLMMENE